ncbi:MAG: NAD(P)H-binding protein [Actinomycetota bacterium]|nr:NAD(P)H-binding protein [Actinomycetota bacterium]
MTEQSMVLVTGATGNVGRQVVSQLLGTRSGVRALTRNPDSAGLPDGVELVRGDLSDPGTLNAGLDGVEAVFLVWPFLTAEAAPAVLEVVGKHVHRIVYLSSMGVRDDVDEQADPINQFHADLERLIEKSGLAWTFLRSHSFATNALWWAPQIRADGVVREPHGAAARPVIHEQDVAAVAVHALTGDGHGGATYCLTGPQVLTQIEQVRIIGEAIGRALRFEEISPEAGRQKMLAAGWPPSVVNGLLNAYARMITQPVPVTSTVQEITGIPPRTFRQWAIDHANDFRPSHAVGNS